MAQFDKTFPTLDCAACILTPKMSAVALAPNITLWTYSEVAKVDGYVGNFTVTVKRKPRYINEDLCVGCQECIEACVFKEPKFPDEFNVGLGKRKPIYIPFPQAVPQVVVIDPELPAFKRSKTGKCKQDLRRGLRRPPRDRLHAEGGARGNQGGQRSSWPPGFRLFDASRMPQYGYGVIRTSSPRWNSNGW